MKKILYIYKITNLLNGKIYIGRHSSDKIDNGYYGSGILIKAAIKKYKKENFKKEVICICNSDKELNEKEVYYINKEKSMINGYNLTCGGVGMLGYSQSKESIQKGILTRKEFYKNNPEVKKRFSDLAKLRVGNKNPFYGKKLSKEHIDKMTKARIAAITGGNNPSAVKVICIDKNIVFDTAKDAAIYCGLSCSTSILKAAKGQLKTAGGYKWELYKKQ